MRPREVDDGASPGDDRWRMPHRLMERMEPLLPERPAPTRSAATNKPRVPDRDAMDAILLVLRTGCTGPRSI